MARFDAFANPNRHARHPLYVDVQSDFVSLSTRLCVPLYPEDPGGELIQGVQGLVHVQGRAYVVDTGNMLAVPAQLLRRSVGRLSPDD